MVNCSAQGCQNKSFANKGNLTFHSFPDDQDLLTAWVRALKRDFWLPNQSSKLCSAHFTEDDFHLVSQHKFLKEDAVPSIFKGSPKKKLKSKKLLVQKVLSSATGKIKPGIPVVQLVPVPEKIKSRPTSVQDTPSSTVKMKPGIPVVQLVRLPEDIKSKKSSVPDAPSSTAKNKSGLPLLKIISLAEEIKSLTPCAPDIPTQTVENEPGTHVAQKSLEDEIKSRKPSVPNVPSPTVKHQPEIPVEQIIHPSILQCLLTDASSPTVNLESENPSVEGISLAEGEKPVKSSVHNTPSPMQTEFQDPVVFLPTEKIKSKKHKNVNPTAIQKLISKNPSMQNEPLIIGQMTNNKIVKYILVQDKIQLQKISQKPAETSPKQDLNKETSQALHSSSDCFMPVILKVPSTPKTVLPTDSNHAVVVPETILPTQGFNHAIIVPETILPIQGLNNAVTVPKTSLSAQGLNNAVVVPKTVLPTQNMNHTVAPTLQPSINTTTKMTVKKNAAESIASLYEQKLKNMQERFTLQKKKLKTLQQSNRRKESRVVSLTSRLALMKKKHFVGEDEFEQLKKSSPILAELLVRQLNRGEKSPTPDEFSVQLQQFSLNLHHYSPHAYNYVRKSFNACLPHSRTISKWYQRADETSTSTKEQSVIQTESYSMDVDFPRQESCLDDEECHNNDNFSRQESSLNDEECHSGASFNAIGNESSLAKVSPVYMAVNVNNEVS